MKMGNSQKKIGLFILGIIIFSVVNLTHFIDKTQSIDPFFTLVFKTNGGVVRPDLKLTPVEEEEKRR